MIPRLLLLLLGVWACSTAVIFIKASEVEPMFLAGIRQIIAALVLSPLFLRAYARHRHEFPLRRLKSTLFPGILLGVHFISWIIGARLATTANASLIVNLVPICMPFFLFAMFREKPTRGEWQGTAFAICGIFLLGGADFNLSPDYFRGDLICFLSMLFFCFYLAHGRRNRAVPSLWLYVVPLYAVGGLFCLCASLVFREPIQVYAPREYWLILGLGIIPTVLGHSILNISMRTLPPQLVSIVNMGQFVFAGFMAYLVSREIPQKSFYLASLLLVSGAVLAVRSHRETTG